MKKIFKSRIFLMIVTAIIVGSISVYATLSITAEDVTYGATTVKSALDTLYTKASTYKNLSTTTTATANDILSGKTAYNNLGELITGNIASNCISSNVPKTSSRKKLTNYKPSKFIVFGFDSNNGSYWGNLYFSNFKTNEYIDFGAVGNSQYSILGNISGIFTIGNDGWYIEYDTTNLDAYYMVCE